jgi:hypothetical protein
MSPASRGSPPRASATVKQEHCLEPRRTECAPFQGSNEDRRELAGRGVDDLQDPAAAVSRCNARSALLGTRQADAQIGYPPLVSANAIVAPIRRPSPGLMLRGDHSPQCAPVHFGYPVIGPAFGGLRHSTPFASGRLRRFSVTQPCSWNGSSCPHELLMAAAVDGRGDQKQMFLQRHKPGRISGNSDSVQSYR